MFYLRNQATGKYVSALIKLRDGQYAIYYRDDISQLDARWATRRGAEAALDRLYASGTLTQSGVLAVIEDNNGNHEKEGTMASELMNSSVELRRIETRIQQHKSSIVTTFFQIGDALNEAKDRQLVPHGQWEAWVETQTDMSLRSAQRLMQVAREVPPEQRTGSIGQLGLKNIVTLMALPEGQREAMADRAVEEGLSSRQLEEAVRKAREEGKAEAAADVAAELKQLQEDYTAASRGRFEAETARDRLQRQYTKMTVDYHRLADDHKAASERLEELAKALEDAETYSSSGISPEAQAQIDQLKAEKAQAEMATQRAMERRQLAEQELLKLKRSANRENMPLQEQYQGLTLAAFSEACRMFIGRAGVLPQMGAQMAELTPREKLEWSANVDMLAQFVEGARAALNCVKGEIIDG